MRALVDLDAIPIVGDEVVAAFGALHVMLLPLALGRRLLRRRTLLSQQLGVAAREVFVLVLIVRHDLPVLAAAQEEAQCARCPRPDWRLEPGRAVKTIRRSSGGRPNAGWHRRRGRSAASPRPWSRRCIRSHCGRTDTCI